MLDISFSFLNFWSRQSSDLNIIICESFDLRPHLLPHSPNLITATSSALIPLLTKVTSIKTAFYKRSLEILRISEADECFNWTIVCSPNHFTFWEGGGAPVERRRKWLPSRLSLRPVVLNEAEAWLWLSLSWGWDPRCSRCCPRWSCPWGGSRSCRSRGPCSPGGWRRAAASAGQRTPGRSSTGRCNTPVGRLQQFNVDQHVGNSEIVMFQWMNGEIRDFTFWEIFFSLFGSHACKWPTKNQLTTASVTWEQWQLEQEERYLAKNFQNWTGSSFDGSRWVPCLAKGPTATRRWLESISDAVLQAIKSSASAIYINPGLMFLKNIENVVLRTETYKENLRY